MRYLIDNLDLPQKVKEIYSTATDAAKKKNLRAFTYVFVCQKCGVELYSEFKYEDSSDFGNDRIRTYSLEQDAEKTWKYTEEERNAFKQQIKERKLEQEELKRHHALAQERYYASLNDAVCPICGAKLLQEKGFFYPDQEIYESENKYLDFYECKNRAEELYGVYINKYGYCSLDIRFCKLENVRQKLMQEKSDALLESYIQACDIFATSGSSSIASAVKKDCASLKAYILNLIRLENNIYSLQKLLLDLYYRRLRNNPTVAFETYYPIYQAQEELKELREAYRNALEAVRNAEEYQPVVDIKYPIEPSAPLLKKPGLFNKQKVLAENEILTKQYQADMAAYQQEVLRCDEEKKYLITEKRNAALANALKIEAEAKTALEAAEAGLDTKRTALKEQLTPAKAVKALLDQEITATEELLKKTYAARNELYAYDIVFGKYRNPVALSSFYEYLMSGRCSALEGADGAYNIYEGEKRANRVIAQLDTVISSLEDIKENQYMMYQEMCSANAQLSRLNSTMDQALTSIQSIETNTMKIAENSEVIAHNTAVTAYYSKVNAELTNALGYMVAFK